MKIQYGQKYHETDPKKIIGGKVDQLKNGTIIEEEKVDMHPNGLRPLEEEHIEKFKTLTDGIVTVSDLKIP